MSAAARRKRGIEYEKGFEVERGKIARSLNSGTPQRVCRQRHVVDAPRRAHLEVVCVPCDAVIAGCPGSRGKWRSEVEGAAEDDGDAGNRCVESILNAAVVVVRGVGVGTGA